MGGVGLVACQGFLLRGACTVFCWVEMDLFSLECNDVCSSEFWSVYWFGITLGSPSFNVQDCAPVLLEN